jgi:hypothetical protein
MTASMTSSFMVKPFTRGARDPTGRTLLAPVEETTSTTPQTQWVNQDLVGYAGHDRTGRQYVYIGIGTVVLILLIVLAVMLLRGRAV